VKTSGARHLSRFSPGSLLEKRISDTMLVKKVPVLNFQEVTKLCLRSDLLNFYPVLRSSQSTKKLLLEFFRSVAEIVNGSYSKCAFP